MWVTFYYILHIYYVGMDHHDSEDKNAKMEQIKMKNQILYSGCILFYFLDCTYIIYPWIMKV